jgi:heme iron utilization protein
MNRDLVNNVTPLHPKIDTLPDKLALVHARLAEKPDGVIEAVAREFGVPTQMVLEALPPEARIFVGPAQFEDIWQNLTTWGDVLFIVHTQDIVLECQGALPAGTFGAGYFNIHGDSPIGGHIKAANCRAIYLVDRLFHGRRSCSVQFFNAEGEAMFKVFVRRDEKRELLLDQCVKFEALAARLQA